MRINWRHCNLLLAFVVGALLSEVPVLAAAQSKIVFKKTTDGLIAPFKIKEESLYEFVSAYSRMTGLPVTTEGVTESEIRGKVTLFSPIPIREEALVEYFHQALFENGYTVVESAEKGWVIQRLRDARDGVLPLYDSAQFPNTNRLIRVVHATHSRSAESIARELRAMAAATTRMTPTSDRQFIIVDSGRNIRRLLQIAEKLDTSAAAKADAQVKKEREEREFQEKLCAAKEKKIEKLVVEKLEIHEKATIDVATSSQPSNRMGTKGGRK